MDSKDETMVDKGKQMIASFIDLCKEPLRFEESYEVCANALLKEPCDSEMYHEKREILVWLSERTVANASTVKLLHRLATKEAKQAADKRLHDW